MYIVLFLHQTTTGLAGKCLWSCCISYYSYIKPQPNVMSGDALKSCISYYSYIKPQRMGRDKRLRCCCISYYSYIKPQLKFVDAANKSVVYRTIPTSNHNSLLSAHLHLLVVYRTIPTSNHNWWSLLFFTILLYIVLFLHQTTTSLARFLLLIRCISYYSYIKPQPK